MPKKPRYELIIFDWDGTLMDSPEKIVRCLSAAAADLGLPDPGVRATRQIIGLGLHEALEQLFPGTDRSVHAQIVERYREHFLHRDKTHMPLFPGVMEGLAQLTEQGYLLAVATGKARQGLDRVLEMTGTRHYFVATRCADESNSKPHPQMLHDILNSTGIEARNALMVGDTVFDLQMAANAQVDSLAVSYGAHDREQLLTCTPLACVDSFIEVYTWLT